MSQLNLRKIPDDQLLTSTHAAVKRERQATIDVLRHLEEIQRRELFLERGYPSLFEMCVKVFGDSNGAIQRRLDALKLLKVVPEVEEKIENGTLSLSSAAAIQSFLQLEERKDGSKLSLDYKLEIVGKCEDKSSREVERELARMNPDFGRRESAKPVGDDDMRLTVTVTEEFWRKIERLKALRSHASASMKTEELLAWLVELGLDQVDPVRKAERAEARASNRVYSETKSLPAPEVKPRTRYIDATVRHETASAVTNGCDYVDPLPGRRCGSQYFLQRDHITPYSHGGEHSATNLRWLCGPHNRLSYRKPQNSRVESPAVSYVA